jgi:hypothetical protein
MCVVGKQRNNAVILANTAWLLVFFINLDMEIQMTTINRPNVTVIVARTGKMTYSVDHEAWSVRYIRRADGEDKAEVVKKAKAFKKLFNKIADEIESGDTRPYFIMEPFVREGYFTPERKMDPRFANAGF